MIINAKIWKYYFFKFKKNQIGNINQVDDEFNKIKTKIQLKELVSYDIEKNPKYQAIMQSMKDCQQRVKSVMEKSVNIRSKIFRPPTIFGRGSVLKNFNNSKIITLQTQENDSQNDFSQLDLSGRQIDARISSRMQNLQYLLSKKNNESQNFTQQDLQSVIPESELEAQEQNSKNDINITSDITSRRFQVLNTERIKEMDEDESNSEAKI